MPSAFFYLPLVSFFTGIVLGDPFQWDGFFLFTLLISFSLGGLTVFHLGRKRGRDVKAILICFTSIIFLFLGILRYETHEADLERKRAALEEGGAVLAGVVLAEPKRDERVEVVVSLLAPEQDILVRSAHGADVSYGDTVIVQGKLERVKNFDSEGRFNYEKYLQKEGIQYVMNFAQIEITERGGGSYVFKKLLMLKEWFVHNIFISIPEPYASLGSGMTIAGKGGLPDDLEEDFIRAGLIHIVVLSGANIAIVIKAVTNALGFLGRRTRTIAALHFVVIFILVSGGSAPVVRAGIMASIATIGSLFYKQVIQNRALFAAAFFMILIKPGSLLYDPSFALSFLATLAIINIGPIVYEKISFVTERGGLRRTLSETLGVEIFLFPYILCMMGSFSLIAPVANMIVVPLIPLAMFLSFLAGIIGWIPFLSFPISFLLWLLLASIVWITEFLSSLPFAVFETKLFSFSLMYLCYACLLFFMWKRMKAGK